MEEDRINSSREISTQTSDDSHDDTDAVLAQADRKSLYNRIMNEHEIMTDMAENQKQSNSPGQGDVGGSEETFDKMCQVCLEDEKHVEAFMFCEECEEYLCEHCVTMHRGVRLTKKHNLLPLQALEERGSHMRIKSREPCPFHSNEYLEWFCKSDFSLGCSVCTATSHVKCTDVIPLSEAAVSILTEQKLQETVQELETTKTKVRSGICKGQILQENLDKDRNQSLEELEAIQKDIEKMFESVNGLLQRDKTIIESKYREISQSIDTSVANFSKIESTLDKSVATLTSERVNDECKFVHVMKAEQNLKTITNTLKNFEPSDSVLNICYERDKSLDKKLISIDNIGFIDQDKQLYTVTQQKVITVTKEKEIDSDITAVCQVDGQRLLLADWVNSSLKLVNTMDESVSDVFHLKSRPFDVCRVDAKERFAISVPHAREVRFVTLNDSSVIKSGSPLEIKEICLGIAYYNSELFVLCGGGAIVNEGPGHVRVYILNGTLQRTVIQDSLCRTSIENPRRIRIRPNTNKAFLTDGRRILQMNLDNF